MSVSSLYRNRIHVLRILAREREKRKNPQYKSVAFRQLRYDRIEVSLFTYESCVTGRHFQEKMLTIQPHSGLTDCDETECTKDANFNG